ncbi:DivIVA domain-containing protein [Spiractinospora alimapuensis]|uniref:DivIVA domain-containing protein n=1 Tax=Spiractinospora alimapuensis TaxID=2820884 RepID=UPI001F2571F4|nr:DivIVA domain-containing protein [Spiractinospora alimapuensis]QVQ53479.1 DivIVA domain-containing protein [Spiractinospora alimapuensis]
MPTLEHFFYADQPVTFTTVLRGYDQRQVTEFLDRVRLTRGAPPPVAVAELRQQSFDVVLRGFDRREVDTYVSDFADYLTALESP